MKILVTGASGGMGSYIISELLERGIEVIATSRDESKVKHEVFFQQISYVPYDLTLRSGENLFVKFGKPDSIIHLAWDKLNNHKSELHTTTILDDHRIFLSNLVTNGLPDVNVLGTCYEYGLREGLLKETDPPAPVVAYAIAKNQLRMYLEELAKEFQFTMKWLRVFNVFSEGKSGGNLFTHLTNAINNNDKIFNMSGGEQVRDYLTAKEVAELIVKTSIQKEVTGIINCASGKPVKLKEMVTEFLKRKGSDMKLNLGYYPYLDHEPMSHWAYTGKLQQALKASEVFNIK
jgi:nucleoside-diphosphate-sugar epimerase